MTNLFALPILIFIKPSPWLTGSIIFVHLGAVLALFVADLHWYTRGVIAIIITACFINALVTSVFQNLPDTPVQLLLTVEDEWWLTTVSGQTFAAELLPAAFVHPLFTVLSFRGGRRHYSVILMPDVVDADMFRRLRVRLGFMHHQEPQKV